MTLDAQTATDVYINALGAETLEKAAAYTLGNHWSLLWGLLIAALVTWIIIKFKMLDKIDNEFSRQSLWLRSCLISGAFILLSSLLMLPWTIYHDWWRELSYGRTQQTLPDFLSQVGIKLLISSILGGLFFSGVYFSIRRLGQKWWLWSGALTAVSIASLMLLGPILIEPMFNQYTPLPKGEVRDALEVLAKQANISPDRILVFDGSRQSNNFTANVSGIGASARIAISDAALKSASLDEVKAVTGHEIGHYVSNHIWNLIGMTTVLSMLFFYLTNRLFPWLAKQMDFPVHIHEPKGVGILMLCISFFSFLAQPLTNFVVRHGEIEADHYSFVHVNLPDAMASALVKTAVYRNPRPHPVQEFIFYSHPAVEKRVRAAMDWKANNP